MHQQIHCTFFTCALALTGLSMACTHKPAPGESINEVCIEDNHSKEVSVSGYLVVNSGDVYCDGDGCPFFLSRTVNGSEDKHEIVIRVSLFEGTQPRGVEIKKRENFGNKDLVFRDDNSNTFNLAEPVRLTGKVDVHQVGEITTCTMWAPTSVQKL